MQAASLVCVCDHFSVNMQLVCKTQQLSFAAAVICMHKGSCFTCQMMTAVVGSPLSEFGYESKLQEVVVAEK